jgi:putative tryptophan/tyrosine transport system substrate-binding protein
LGSREGAGLIGKTLTEVTDEHLRRAFAELAEEKVDALLVGQSGNFRAKGPLIIELAAKYRLPAIYPFRDYVEQGGLVAYAPDLNELAKRMANDVHQILGGAKPGDIPYFLPTKFELAINLKTARALGLTVSPTLLVEADEVIE